MLLLLLLLLLRVCLRSHVCVCVYMGAGGRGGGRGAMFDMMTNLCMLLLCVMLSVVFNLSTKCSRFHTLIHIRERTL